MIEQKPPTQQPMRIALSITETATALNLSRPTVYELIERGRLRAVKCGKRRLIAVSELERFMSDNAGGGDVLRDHDAARVLRGGVE